MELKQIASFQVDHTKLVEGMYTSRVVECGNYREQDLEGAKNIARKMIPILRDWTPADLAYEK